MNILSAISCAAAAALITTGFVPAQANPPRTVELAYDHLDWAMDEWAQAPALRVPSSYHGGFLDFWDNSVTYDHALVAIAYANHEKRRGLDADSLRRARVIGDTFLQMQAKDPIGDGRLRNAYGPERLWDSQGNPNIQTFGAATGNNAWVGMALMHIYEATGDGRYLKGAERVGDWLIRHTWDDRGAGGFTGGFNSDGSQVSWKSAEHNIDAAGLFGMLAEVTGKSKWKQAAEHARGFVEAMWLPEEEHFAIGTLNDGVRLNLGEYVPEDVQAWDNLLLDDARYEPALAWTVANLQVTDRSRPRVPLTGVRFALQVDEKKLDHNDDTVWLEGTAHTALALRCAGGRTNQSISHRYLSTLQTAQRRGPNADGKGIQANSSEGYAGGDGINYTSLHTGTTAWYVMARSGINPFHLGTAGDC